MGRNARMLLWSTLQPSQGGSTHPQLPSRTILGHGRWHQGPLPHASLQLLPALRGTWPPAGPDRLPLSPPHPVYAGDRSAGRGPGLGLGQGSVPNSIHKFSRETSLLRARKGRDKREQESSLYNRNVLVCAQHCSAYKCLDIRILSMPCKQGVMKPRFTDVETEAL